MKRSLWAKENAVIPSLNIYWFLQFFSFPSKSYTLVCVELFLWFWNKLMFRMCRWTLQLDTSALYLGWCVPSFHRDLFLQVAHRLLPLSFYLCLILNKWVAFTVTLIASLLLAAMLIFHQCLKRSRVAMVTTEAQGRGGGKYIHVLCAHSAFELLPPPGQKLYLSNNFVNVKKNT